MKLLKQIREKRKLSIRKMANLVGKSPSFISELEKGTRTPSTKTIHSIAKKLGYREALFRSANKIEPEIKNILTEKQTYHFCKIISKLEPVEREIYLKKFETFLLQKVAQKNDF